MKKFISYGKNVYNKEEIFAVNNTLKKTTRKNFRKKSCKDFW